MRNWRVLTAIAAVVLAALAGVLGVEVHRQRQERCKEAVHVHERARGEVASCGEHELRPALDSGLIAREQRVRNDVPASGHRRHEDRRGAEEPVQGPHRRSRHRRGPDDRRSGLRRLSGSVASGLGGTLEHRRGQGQGKNNAQAISVNLDDTHAVGGFLTPGDRVNVIATVDEHRRPRRHASRAPTDHGVLAAGRQGARGRRDDGHRRRRAARRSRRRTRRRPRRSRTRRAEA